MSKIELPNSSMLDYPKINCFQQSANEEIFANLVRLAALESKLGKLNLSRNGTMVKFLAPILDLREEEMIARAIATDNELLRIILIDFMLLPPLERFASFADLMDRAIMFDEISHSINNLLVAASHDDKIADIFALFGAPEDSGYPKHVFVALVLIEMAANWQGFWKALEKKIQVIPFTLAQLLRGVHVNLALDHHQSHFRANLKLIHDKIEQQEKITASPGLTATSVVPETIA
ncbi:MAG: hypothetical protein ORO03_02890 [Alphaproteobacteria bacterium]|nr:hypothetical protein [Alphaproteobacteria bacterium]